MKTIKKTVAKPGPGRHASPPGGMFHDHTHLTQTMEIPVEALFDWVSGTSAACLEVTLPNKPVLRIQLGKDVIDIGRDSECRICIPAPNVSRRHAEIRIIGEEYRIDDLESTNGTFINGVRVSRCILRNNDQIRIGDARIAFVQQRIRETT